MVLSGIVGMKEVLSYLQKILKEQYVLKEERNWLKSLVFFKTFPTNRRNLIARKSKELIKFLFKAWSNEYDPQLLWGVEVFIAYKTTAISMLPRQTQLHAMK